MIEIFFHFPGREEEEEVISLLLSRVENRVSIDQYVEGDGKVVHPSFPEARHEQRAKIQNIMKGIERSNCSAAEVLLMHDAVTILLSTEIMEEDERTHRHHLHHGSQLEQSGDQETSGGEGMSIMQVDSLDATLGKTPLHYSHVQLYVDGDCMRERSVADLLGLFCVAAPRIAAKAYQAYQLSSNGEMN